jgi:hypothetical protein
MESIVHAWLADGRRGELVGRVPFVVDTFLNGARGRTGGGAP